MSDDMKVTKRELFKAIGGAVPTVKLMGQALAAQLPQTTVIRRRFEVHSVNHAFGHLCFAALPHRRETPIRVTDSLADVWEWGSAQQKKHYSPISDNTAVRLRIRPASVTRSVSSE